GIANRPRLHAGDRLERTAPQSAVPLVFRVESAFEQRIAVVDRAFFGPLGGTVAGHEPEAVAVEAVFPILAVQVDRPPLVLDADVSAVVRLRRGDQLNDRNRERALRVGAGPFLGGERRGVAGLKGPKPQGRRETAAEKEQAGARRHDRPPRERASEKYPFQT